MLFAIEKGPDMTIERASSAAAVAQTLGVRPNAIGGYARRGMIPFETTPAGIAASTSMRCGTRCVRYRQPRCPVSPTAWPSRLHWTRSSR